jgi:hypothetical protein
VTRTVGHWVLVALALLLLAAFGTFLWWFGPWHGLLGFGLWALASGPLLIAAYSRTRIRWLLYVGTGLIPAGLIIAFMSESIGMWGTWQGLLAMSLSASLPLALTLAWLRRFLGRSPHETQNRWTMTNAGPLLAAVVTIVPAFAWARAEMQELVSDPAHTSAFAGCYELEFGRWIPSAMMGHSVHGIVPARVQLDTVRGDPVRRETMYDTFERSELLIRPGWWGSAYWEPISRERVRLIWNTGFHGVGLDLRRHGLELRGKATGHTDVSGLPWPETRARVRARPIDCSLVPADTARAGRTGVSEGRQ